MRRLQGAKLTDAQVATHTSTTAHGGHPISSGVCKVLNLPTLVLPEGGLTATVDHPAYNQIVFYITITPPEMVKGNNVKH